LRVYFRKINNKLYKWRNVTNDILRLGSDKISRGGKLFKTAALMLTLFVFVSASYAADSSVDYSADVNGITDENSDNSPEINDLITDESSESGEEQTDDENNELTDEDYDFDEITDDYYYFDELVDTDDAIDEYYDEYLPEEFDDTLYDEYYDEYLPEEFDGTLYNEILPEDFYDTLYDEYNDDYLPEEFDEENGDSEEFTDESDYTDGDSGIIDAIDEYLDDQYEDTFYWDDLIEDSIDLDDGNIFYNEISGYNLTENLYDSPIYTFMSNNINNESNISEDNQPLSKNNKNTQEKTNNYSTENQNNEAQTGITNQPEINGKQDNSGSDNSSCITPKITIAGNPLSSDNKGLLDLILEFITKIFYR
jgi:hypothetical protein